MNCIFTLFNIANTCIWYIICRNLKYTLTVPDNEVVCMGHMTSSWLFCLVSVVFNIIIIFTLFERNYSPLSLGPQKSKAMMCSLGLTAHNVDIKYFSTWFKHVVLYLPHCSPPNLTS